MRIRNLSPSEGAEEDTWSFEGRSASGRERRKVQEQQLCGLYCSLNVVTVTNTLKEQTDLNYISTSSPYRTVNTLSLGYKNHQLKLYREIIAVCSQTHTKHINTGCGQNVELLNVKPSGTYSNHWALNG